MKNSDTTLSVSGMHCSSCVNKVKTALSPFASNINVTLTPPSATLSNTKATLSQLNKALAEVGAYKVTKTSRTKSPATSPRAENEAPQSWLTTYQPLLIIVAYILGVSIAIEFSHPSFDVDRWMIHFMAGFFLVFSFFKMLNIRAFASSYAMYDLLAMRVKSYGQLYPFIELGLGLAYLLVWSPMLTNAITLAVMSFSSLGVMKAVMNKQKIRCACLGTVFNLPMSTITIIEDLLMAGMAAWMLI